MLLAIYLHVFYWFLIYRMQSFSSVVCLTCVYHLYLQHFHPLVLTSERRLSTMLHNVTDLLLDLISEFNHDIEHHGFSTASTTLGNLQTSWNENQVRPQTKVPFAFYWMTLLLGGGWWRQWLIWIRLANGSDITAGEIFHVSWLRLERFTTNRSFPFCRYLHFHWTREGLFKHTTKAVSDCVLPWISTRTHTHTEGLSSLSQKHLNGPVLVGWY